MCLLASLVCDGLVAGTQDGMKAGYKKQTGQALKPYDLMMFTNLAMLVVALGTSLALDQFWGGVAFVQANPEILSKVNLSPLKCLKPKPCNMGGFHFTYPKARERQDFKSHSAFTHTCSFAQFLKAVCWRKVFQFAACSAIGQSAIFFTIANFDPLICTTVTTTRKIFSVRHQQISVDKN